MSELYQKPSLSVEESLAMISKMRQSNVEYRNEKNKKEIMFDALNHTEYFLQRDNCRESWEYAVIYEDIKQYGVSLFEKYNIKVEGTARVIPHVIRAIGALYGLGGLLSIFLSPAVIVVGSVLVVQGITTFFLAPFAKKTIQKEKLNTLLLGIEEKEPRVKNPDFTKNAVQEFKKSLLDVIANDIIDISKIFPEFDFSSFAEIASKSAEHYFHDGCFVDDLTKLIQEEIRVADTSGLPKDAIWSFDEKYFAKRFSFLAGTHFDLFETICQLETYQLGMKLLSQIKKESNPNWAKQVKRISIAMATFIKEYFHSAYYGYSCVDGMESVKHQLKLANINKENFNKLCKIAKAESLELPTESSPKPSTVDIAKVEAMLDQMIKGAPEIDQDQKGMGTPLAM